MYELEKAVEAGLTIEELYKIAGVDREEVEE